MSATLGKLLVLGSAACIIVGQGVTASPVSPKTRVAPKGLETLTVGVIGGKLWLSMSSVSTIVGQDR